jgi:hypothetical protein
LLILIFFHDNYRQYLEENVHKTYVDVNEMTQSLMNRYQEYTRRKTIPFRILVEQGEKIKGELIFEI